MPVPANTPALFLGRGVFDKAKFRSDTDPAVIDCLSLIAQTMMGAGWPSPAKPGDEDIKMAVYAEDDGLGAHLLWGGNPADPLSPTPITVSASGSATVIWQEEGSTVTTSGTVNFVGSGVTVTDEGDGKATVTITGGGGGGTVTEAFKTIQVSGSSDIVADAAADTLVVAAGTGMVVTTNAGTDTLTFAIDTAAVAQNSFTTIAVAGQSNVVADGPADTLTLVAGSNMTITTNAAGDEITFASSGGGGYDTIQEDGTPLTQRTTLNFIGDDITATDDVANSRTNVTISPGTGRIFRTTEEISAAVWDGTELALGSGGADILIPTVGDPTVYELSSSGTIYNTVEEVIPADKNVQCKRVNELWIVDVVDCN